MLCARLTYGGAHMRTFETLSLALVVGGFCSCGVDATTSESSTGQQTTSDEVRHVSASMICGGVMGISCLAGQVCIDDPNDSCDPAVRGTDCMGICVVPTGVSCGRLWNCGRRTTGPRAGCRARSSAERRSTSGACGSTVRSCAGG